MQFADQIALFLLTVIKNQTLDNYYATNIVEYIKANLIIFNIHSLLYILRVDYLLS